MVEIVALVIALTSFVVSVFFAMRSMQSSAKANELSESQLGFKIYKYSHAVILLTVV